jgi:glutamate-1-semialdehyde 2,1-aminomutase
MSEKSATLNAKARELSPGGVHSNVRLSGPQVFIDHAKGSRIVDVDGNEYVDYLLGQGPNFLGHAPDVVLDAVDDACRNGMIYGAQHPLEIDAGSTMLEALQWPDQFRFSMTGTEAVQAVLRAARAHTDRTKFVRFAGQYHGWMDNVLVAVDDTGSPALASQGQMASHLEDSIMLPWNDLGALESLLAERGDEIAAVITEPAMLNSGAIVPRDGYLEGIRAACDRYGVVLIFDEVISGFRVALGGAVERFGLTPDLATYGKAMAGGWPVAAFAGKREFMEGFGTGRINHSGTFNASVMACAACNATVRYLIEEPPYDRLQTLGTRLQAGLRSLAEGHGMEVNIQGLPMAFHFGFGSGPVTDYASLQKLDLGGYAVFSEVLVEHGVWVTGRGIWYVSAAHSEADVDETLERVESAMKVYVRDGGRS